MSSQLLTFNVIMSYIYWILLHMLLPWLMHNLKASSSIVWKNWEKQCGQISVKSIETYYSIGSVLEFDSQCVSYWKTEYSDGFGVRPSIWTKNNNKSIDINFMMDLVLFVYIQILISFGSYFNFNGQFNTFESMWKKSFCNFKSIIGFIFNNCR